jgi:hypothetical protein
VTPAIGWFLDDPNLLGGDFAGPSWSAWKMILKAALGESLTADEAARFEEIAQRKVPGQRVR